MTLEMQGSFGQDLMNCEYEYDCEYCENHCENHCENRIFERLRELSKSLRCMSLRVLVLDLNRNRISDPGVACLAQVVPELPLTEFQVALFDNRVGEDGARQMAQSIRGLSRLLRLVLGLNRNAVSEAGVQDIAQALSNKANSLQDLELDLSVSSVGWAGAHDLGLALSSLQLEHLSLDLNVNHVGSAGARLLAQAVACQRNLISLRLLASGNRIREVGARELAQAQILNDSHRFMQYIIIIIIIIIYIYLYVKLSAGCSAPFYRSLYACTAQGL